MVVVFGVGVFVCGVGLVVCVLVLVGCLISGVSVGVIDFSNCMVIVFVKL